MEFPRVVHVTRSFLPLQGGAERFSARLAAAYRRLGGSWTVVAGRFQREWPAIEWMWDGRGHALVLRLFSPRHPRGVGTSLWLAALARFLLKRREDYDAILVNVPKYEAMLCGALRRRLGKPVAVRMTLGGPTGNIEHIENLWTRRFVRRGLKGVDAYVALSRRIAGELEAAGVASGRITMIPNGVDCDLFRPAASPEERLEARRRVDPEAAPEDCVIVAVGRLAPQKGYEYLLEALGGLAGDEDGARARWRLWIAGGGDLRETLEAKAREAGIAGRVRFLGHVEDTPALLRGADLFAQSSLTEGLSSALLEAMATGLAIAATRVSGAEDQIRDGENGWLAPPGDAAALRARIALALGDAEARRRAGEAARRDVVQNLSIEAVARCYAEFLRGLIEARRS